MPWAISLSRLLREVCGSFMTQDDESRSFPPLPAWMIQEINSQVVWCILSSYPRRHVTDQLLHLCSNRFPERPPHVCGHRRADGAPWTGNEEGGDV